jgi:glycerol-3-phosphate acyltransferase PlsY
MVTTLTTILIAYFIGAIPFGLLIARFFGTRDIREAGSGNIGATNVLRVLGMRAAIWVYLLDIGKGAAVIFLAKLVTQTALRPDLFLVLVGVAAVLGHVFPVYLRFRGGKGVATLFGVLVVLMPVETLVAVGVFLIVVALSRYVSLASMVAALSFPASVTVEQSLMGLDVPRVYWLFTVVIGIFVPVAHHSNIRRLMDGTENRLELSRPKGDSDG